MELSLTLDKSCYFPGELLKCLIKVKRDSTAQPADGSTGTQQQQLELLFECSGSERVDPSWVGRLYHPEVTAQKDNKRMVRSIFSTGQVPLLEGAANQGLTSNSTREFIVRCRLPNKLPPSYRGNAVRFLYQVVVRGRLIATGAAAAASRSPLKQQQQQPAAGAVGGPSCQAHASFVVWPQPERSSSNIERRPSMPSGVGGGGPQPSSNTAGGAAAGTAAAGGAAGSTTGGGSGGTAGGGTGVVPPLSSLLEGLQDVEQIDYKLGMQALKLRWEEVISNPDGTKTLLTHEPASTLYPSSSAASQLLQAAHMCAFESLQLEDGGTPQSKAAAAAAAAKGGGGEDGDGDGGAAAAGGGGLQLRHLTPAQRASMSVRTFNLRAGEHPLLRLVLQPPTDGLLQPGGTFGLLLDFRASHGVIAAAGAGAGAGGGGSSSKSSSSLQPVCLQVVALLESEEVVLPPYAPARSSSGITAMRKLYAEQQEVTAHLLTAHFTFSIPLTAPPSFKTPMVCHKWVLRFELLLGKPKPNRPAEMVTEQLLWSLPLVVYPPLTQAQPAGL